jgi:hypothetical protein
MARRFTLAVAFCALIVIGCPLLADDAPDQTTPKAAAGSFFKAMENGDVASAKALASGTDKHLAILDVLVPMISSFKQLENSAFKKWGEEGRKAIRQDQGAFDFNEMLKTAKEEINGDSATIISADNKPENKKDPMKLKKIDGKWKVDMASIPAEQFEDPTSAKLMQSVAGIAKATAAEIDQGKYADAKTAKDAMGQKIIAEITKNAPGNVPVAGDPAKKEDPKK